MNQVVRKCNQSRVCASLGETYILEFGVASDALNPGTIDKNGTTSSYAAKIAASTLCSARL
jgi:hypothetical protein